MRWTRLSLLYVAGYLFLTGIALVIAPTDGPRLLQAERAYDPIFVRSNGAFMIALALLIAQMIRHRVDALYSATLVARVIFLSIFAWLYALTHDRMFIIVLSVVGLGFLLTLVAFLVDRREVAYNREHANDMDGGSAPEPRACRSVQEGAEGRLAGGRR